jgi:hypothetical protein
VEPGLLRLEIDDLVFAGRRLDAQYYYSFMMNSWVDLVQAISDIDTISASTSSL